MIQGKVVALLLLIALVSANGTLLLIQYPSTILVLTSPLKISLNTLTISN